MDKQDWLKKGRTSERRRNTRLRSIYPDARIRLARLFRGQTDGAGSSVDDLAQAVVHEAYPDLSPVEIDTLVSAIEGHLQSELARFRRLQSAA